MEIQVGKQYYFCCKHFDDIDIEDLVVIAKNNNMVCTVVRYSKDGEFGRMYEVEGMTENTFLAYADELSVL